LAGEVKMHRPAESRNANGVDGVRLVGARSPNKGTKAAPAHHSKLRWLDDVPSATVGMNGDTAARAAVEYAEQQLKRRKRDQQ